ncbi:MAG: ATP-dependent DNA ligase [Desulfobacterales bacterium]
MRRFARLFAALDRSRRAREQEAALAAYFRSAPPEDAAWAACLLLGRKPRRAVPTARLRRFAAGAAGIPDWLFEACYEQVGDLAETITLLLPDGGGLEEVPLHVWLERLLPALRGLPEERQRAGVLEAWRGLDRTARLLWNKLVTGGFRVGVSQRKVIRALARLSGLEEGLLGRRLMGGWNPSAEAWRRLLQPADADADAGRPYPFCLAHPLDLPPEALGDPAAWLVEWKWDGIRAQIVRREGEVHLWSRGEGGISAAFPEIRAAAGRLPEGCVLDGEILAWGGERPLDFGLLQRRLGRRNPGGRLLAEIPVVWVGYDLLEQDGCDRRSLPLAARREALEKRLAAAPDPRLRLSPALRVTGWDEVRRLRGEARRRGAEGLVLKRRDSPYAVGRRRGLWYKWKADPYRVDAVLTYARRGHGLRAGLYTDYTFSVWDGGELVPFARAYSGLDAAEIRAVDRFIRANARERFGPVQAVKPELVFEIAFEDIRRSARHKSGVAVRFPRIARLRRDKPAEEADTVETLRALIAQKENTP